MSATTGSSDKRVNASLKGQEVTIPRKRRVLAMLFTFGAVTCLGFAMLEVAFRSFVPVTDSALNFWDPLLGPRLAPNQTGRNVSGAYVNVRYRFNSQGWNHPEDYVVAKPPGARRVCIVGDSQVESLQVNPEEAMYMVAQRSMHRQARPVQWYAFGNSGWGTSIEYEVIRRYALDYKPDVVILLFVQNDPFDCSPYLVDPPVYEVSYFLDAESKLSLVLPSSEWIPPWRWRLAGRFAVVRYFALQRGLWYRFRGVHANRPGVGGLPLRAEGEAPKHSPVVGVSSMSMEERQKKTWELIEKLFEASRDECQRRGAKFVVAFRGSSRDIEVPLTRKTYTVPPKEVDPYCLDERISEMGTEWVGPIASRLDIPYLDLTDALREMVSKTGKSHHFPDDNHYSAAGHAAAGEALAKWVESLWENDAGSSR